MDIAEKLIDVCEQLPGYYGYRPSMQEDTLYIQEVYFQLPDETNDCSYSLCVYLSDNQATHATIDVRYSDGSMAYADESHPVFADILAHKNKLLDIFKQLTTVST